MVDTYVRLFGMKTSTKPLSPLEKGDHPEIDNSEFLDDDSTRTYQSLVGALQWSISISQFDIATAAMMMSSFRAQPPLGHLKCIKRICGYLYKMKDTAICIRIGEPDYSDLGEEEYDWKSMVYGDVSEILPKDAPVPLGNFVMLSHYMTDTKIPFMFPHMELTLIDGLPMPLTLTKLCSEVYDNTNMAVTSEAGCGIYCHLGGCRHAEYNALQGAFAYMHCTGPSWCSGSSCSQCHCQPPRSPKQTANMTRLISDNTLNMCSFRNLVVLHPY